MTCHPTEARTAYLIELADRNAGISTVMVSDKRCRQLVALCVHSLSLALRADLQRGHCLSNISMQTAWWTAQLLAGECTGSCGNWAPHLGSLGKNPSLACNIQAGPSAPSWPGKHGRWQTRLDATEKLCKAREKQDNLSDFLHCPRAIHQFLYFQRMGLQKHQDTQPLKGKNTLHNTKRVIIRRETHRLNTRWRTIHHKPYISLNASRICEMLAHTLLQLFLRQLILANFSELR